VISVRALRLPLKLNSDFKATSSSTSFGEGFELVAEVIVGYVHEKKSNKDQGLLLFL